MPGGFQQDPMSTTGLAKSTNVLRNPQIGINVSNNAGMAPPKPNLTPAGGGPLPATSQGVQVASQGIYPPGQGPVTSQVGPQGPVQPSVLTPQPGRVDQVGAMPQEPYFGNFGMTRMAYEIGKAAAAIDHPGMVLNPISNTLGRAGVLVGGIPADILAGGFPTGGMDAWRSPQSNREDHERSLEMMNAEYPEELEDTKVRLGAPDMVDDLLWKRESPGEDLPWHKRLGGRVLQNRKTSPVGKLLGYPGTAVLDVFQSLTRLPGYNSASDVVHNPWKNTSMTELGLGRAAAMQQLSGSGRKDKGYLSRLPRKAVHDLAMIASNVPVFGSAEMNALAADRVRKAYTSSMPTGESPADKEIRMTDQATYRKHQEKKDKEKKDKEKKEASVMLHALGRAGVSEQLIRKLAMIASHKWQKAPDQRGADVDLSDVSRKTKIDSKVGPGGSSAGLFAPKMAANMRTVSPVSRIVKNNSPSQSKWSEGHKYQGSSNRKVS